VARVGGASFSRDSSRSADSLLTFPCELAIKIFGRNVAEFREAALAVVRMHYPELSEQAIIERVSRERAYLSLTITVRMQTRAQADALYRDLSRHEQVLMVL
jgi:putative lipoic acid-binding regulatory protein